MTNEDYVSARGRALAIVVMMIVQLSMLALSSVAYVIGIGTLDDSPGIAGISFVVAGLLDILGDTLWLATFIVFLTWVHRSIANLPALGSTSCRFTPAWGVKWFLIPFANLVLGYQVMATVWQESQPRAVDEHGYYLPRQNNIVSLWWVLALISLVAGLATRQSNVVEIAGLRSLGTRQVVLSLVHLLEGALFLTMVRATQKRQDEMWLDLERRRDVPQPSAAALR
jgi:hypothetical protein